MTLSWEVSEDRCKARANCVESRKVVAERKQVLVKLDVVLDKVSSG